MTNAANEVAEPRSDEPRLDLLIGTLRAVHRLRLTRAGTSSRLEGAPTSTSRMGRLGIVRRAQFALGLLPSSGILGPMVTWGRRVCVGSPRAGVLRSCDAGRSFTPSSGADAPAMMWSVARHAASGRMYAGAEPAAIFRSDDDGASWSACASLDDLPRRDRWTFPRPPVSPHVRHIAIAAEDPDHVYAAIEEGWLVESHDGGRSFRAVHDGIEIDAHGVALIGSSRVLVTTGRGAFHRTGSGAFERSTGTEGLYLSAPVVHPVRRDEIWVAGSLHPPPQWFRPGGSARTRFYVSRDGGASFDPTPRMDPSRGGCWAATSVPGHRGAGPFFGLSNGEVWSADGAADGGEPLVRVEGPVTSLGVVVDA